MRVSFTQNGWIDYTSWTDDRKILKRINRLIAGAAHESGIGMGKLEPLSGNLSVHWSRRVDQERRLV